MLLVSPTIPRQKRSRPEMRLFTCDGDAYTKALAAWEAYPWEYLDRVIHIGIREHKRHCYRPHSRSGSYTFRLFISEELMDAIKHEDWFFQAALYQSLEQENTIKAEGYDFELFGMKGTILHKSGDWLEILH